MLLFFCPSSKLNPFPQVLITISRFLMQEKRMGKPRKRRVSVAFEIIFSLAQIPVKHFEHWLPFIISSFIFFFPLSACLPIYLTKIYTHLSIFNLYNYLVTLSKDNSHVKCFETWPQFLIPPNNRPTLN